MTVSRALRGLPGVSPERAKAICAAAKKMGYAPNPLVSAWMHRRKAQKPPQQTTNLGFIHYLDSPNLEDAGQYFGELHQGAMSRANALGYTLDVIWGAAPDLDPARIRQMLQARGIAGLVFAPLPIGRFQIDFEWEHFAVASMGFSLREPEIHRAGSYQYHSIPQAYRELYKLGYRSIGLCVSDQGNLRVEAAWEGSLALLKSELEAGSLQVLPHTIDTADALSAWLKAYPIDAMINMGRPDLRDLFASLGLRLPEDLGYVSFSDPEAATVRRDWIGIGAEAVNLVDSQLMHNERGVPEKAKTVLIEGTWDPGLTVKEV